jgi:hypothetical protein
MLLRMFFMKDYEGLSAVYSGELFACHRDKPRGHSVFVASTALVCLFQRAWNFLFHT